MRAYRGFSILELLIVLTIVGIVGTIGFLNGRRIADNQSAQGSLATIQQSIWQGATAAAARGVTIELIRTGNRFTLQAGNDVLRTFDLADGVATNLGENGLALRFLPPGKVDLETLTALPDDLYILAEDRRYDLRVSMIGEVIAEATAEAGEGVPTP